MVTGFTILEYPQGQYFNVEFRLEPTRTVNKHTRSLEDFGNPMPIFAVKLEREVHDSLTGNCPVAWVSPRKTRSNASSVSARQP